MELTDKLDNVYNKHMRQHNHGYALYKPVSSDLMRPGSCGYFDDSGSWNPILDLNDGKSLQKHGLCPPKGLNLAPVEDNISWGPKTSQGVTEQKIDVSLGVGAAITGLPISLNTQLKYSTDRKFGAILVTAPPVRLDRFYYEYPFKAWFKENVNVLLSGSHAEEVKKYGLFVITQTYSTAQCSLTSWTDSSREVFLGFDVETASNLTLGPHMGWSLGNSAHSWNHYKALGESRLVVFASGFLV
jgi:hypothetical protein